jgi:hypothetical protein
MLVAGRGIIEAIPAYFHETSIVGQRVRPPGAIKGFPGIGEKRHHPVMIVALLLVKPILQQPIEQPP